uniref:SFRICE_005908 n=1 Tax=Spodoptera frugiperda TaxID=7108 RepID=A0A2H1VDJ9_SPOFR
MARFSVLCVLVVVLSIYLERADAASRPVRSPQFGRPHPPFGPPPPPGCFGPGCGPYGRFERRHHFNPYENRGGYYPPGVGNGGSISISKTISISAGGNAQSSASSSAGGGRSSAGSQASSIGK